MISPTVITSSDPTSLLETAAKDFAEFLTKTKSLSTGKIRVVLTGGTLGIGFIRAIDKLALDLDRVWFIFGDERYVGLDHPDRNEHQGLSQIADPERYQLQRYPDAVSPLKSAELELEATLDTELGDISNPDQVFDLVILGVGPDGHVASLFPEHTRTGGWVISEPDSPKPPQQRLSLSYEALNRAGNVWFLASGEAKASVVSRALTELDCDLPLAKVAGRQDTRWYLDQELSDAL